MRARFALLVGVLVAGMLPIANRASAQQPVRVAPCAAQPAPPQPNALVARAQAPAAAAKPGTTPMRPVDAPLIDARERPRTLASTGRAELEARSIATSVASLPGRQQGPARERLRAVMANPYSSSEGYREFGGLLANKYFFPETTDVVTRALDKARTNGWVPRDATSGADLVIARVRPHNDGDKPPFTLEFLVPPEKQKELEALQADLEKLVPNAAMAESARRLRAGSFGNVFGAAAKGKDGLAPAVSVRIDMSGELATQFATEKDKALRTVAEGAYTVGMEKEAIGLLGRRRGERDRLPIGQNIARGKITSMLASDFGQPGNAKVREIADVASWQLLSEIANRPELATAVGQLGKSGAGSELGLILDPRTAATQRGAFGTRAGELGMMMRLPGGQAVSLRGLTANELAQLFAWSALESKLTPESVQKRIDELRAARPAPKK